ncbi:hypothetical protein SAMN04488061_3343 [Filomicrobium insigne]|uniref:TMhelix containing protein n=1 Tax=Filomicrobium insigne TaxID=418854 RepID=A0A1H0TRV4_9HYPH|nr:hypothetical protein [Filomicrobium insigne]SDP56699.1 hypothetical protein SAMN04488061_3343 [Filomicrobium insigne]
MAKYKKVGEGKIEVYEKQKSDWGNVVVWVVIAFFAYAAFFGGK